MLGAEFVAVADAVHRGGSSKRFADEHHMAATQRLGVKKTVKGQTLYPAVDKIEMVYDTVAYKPVRSRGPSSSLEVPSFRSATGDVPPNECVWWNLSNPHSQGFKGAKLTRKWHKTCVVMFVMW